MQGTVGSQQELRIHHFRVAPLLLLYVLGSVAVSTRIDGTAYLVESLWYEDGYMLINQAHRYGLGSILIPHSGQLFLYQRIIAILTIPVSLEILPYVFSLGWLFSFLCIIWVIHKRSSLLGLNYPSTAFLVTAIALQPSHGEPFFNLCHASSFMGVAMALFLCIPDKRRVSIAEVVFLIVASLTGGASIIMVPTLALQLILLRDFSSRKIVYLIVVSGAIIQAFFAIGSERLSWAGNVDLRAWLRAIHTFFLFGKTGTFIIVVGAAFWLLTVLYFVKWIFSASKCVDRYLRLAPLFAAVTSILMFLVSAWSLGDDISSMSPLDMASRHYLIPYSLLIFIAIFCTKNNGIAQATVASLFFLICGVAFATVDRADRAGSLGLLAHDNLQWVAFSKFQKIRPSLIIPINAALPTYPPFAHVQIVQDNERKADGIGLRRDPLYLSVDLRASSADRLDVKGDQAYLSSAGKTPSLSFNLRDYCEGQEYLAIEVDIVRSRMGLAQLFWGRPGEYTSAKSLTRFYPAGSITMQFAFERSPADRWVRFDPAKGISDSVAVRRNAGVAEWQDKSPENSEIKRFFPPMTGAEPTEPGGDVEINAVRLFCLD